MWSGSTAPGPIRTRSRAAAPPRWRNAASGSSRPSCWPWRSCSGSWWWLANAGWTGWSRRRSAVRSNPSRAPEALRQQAEAGAGTSLGPEPGRRGVRPGSGVPLRFRLRCDIMDTF
uniref:Uncharacterized protein n=1 Tax=Tetraodon nigroviridis TaxID=99883 RepID=H3CG99_TETNG